jgi:hypothetical protein
MSGHASPQAGPRPVQDPDPILRRHTAPRPTAPPRCGVPAQILGGPQIDRHAAQQRRQLGLDPREADQAGSRPRRELDQKVDIAVRPCRAHGHRPEQRQPADVVAPAERHQGLAVGEQGRHGSVSADGDGAVYTGEGGGVSIGAMAQAVSGVGGERIRGRRPCRSASGRRGAADPDSQALVDGPGIEPRLGLAGGRRSSPAP